jgi:hypothetical protein
MSSTSKPKLIWQTKVSWKHYRDLFNLEMKEHNRDDNFFGFFKILDASGLNICKELNMLWIWYERI